MTLGIHALIGVGAEEVALGLDQVGGKSGSPKGIEIGQRHHQDGYHNLYGSTG